MLDLAISQLFGVPVIVVEDAATDTPVAPLCGPSRRKPLTGYPDTPQGRADKRHAMTARADQLMAQLKAQGLEVY